MRHGPFFGLWMWRIRTDRWPWCPSLFTQSASLWSAWPDDSGWRDNRTAAQHLLRDLLRSSSGLKERAQTMKKLSHTKKNISFNNLLTQIVAQLNSLDIFNHAIANETCPMRKSISAFFCPMTQYLLNVLRRRTMWSEISTVKSVLVA